MPVYNPGDYLVEAIQSIREQTYKHWELIAIDDGSSDDSVDTLKRYRRRDKRIKIIRMKRHRGIVKSLNAGIRKAKGYFIARMDADDISHPERLQKQVNYLLNNKDVMIVGTQVEMIDKNDRILGVKHFPLDHRAIHEMLFYLCPMQHATIMTYWSVLQNEPYTNHFATEDLVMFFKLIQRGRFANMDEVLYQYRMLHNSHSFNKVKYTFYSAFFVRIKSLFEWNYRPTPKGIFLLIAQLILLATLPQKILTNLFAFVRFRKNQRSLYRLFKHTLAFK